MLTMHEGKRKRPYKCTAGKTTIGVGRNLDDVGLSDEEIDLLLENDIKRCKEEAHRFPWFKDLDSVRQDVVLSMIFNLGYARFVKFTNTIHFIENKLWQSAAIEMLKSQWAVQVGIRSKDLSNLMLYGDYSKVFGTLPGIK